IVRSHHERLDGRGFPDGLAGDQIPLEVRVVTIADSFDAMTSVRPYRPALSVQKALQELEEGKDAQFHAPAVEAVLAAFPDASGPAFAAAVTAGLTSVGCDVIDVGLVPTPTVQLAVEHHHAGGGIAITASHNPIEWNALKFIGPDGIFLDGAEGKRVAELVAQDGGRGTRDAGRVAVDPDAVQRHPAAVLNLPGLDIGGLRKRTFTVA